MTLKNILIKNRTFLIPVIISLLTGILFLLIYDKEQIHIWLNAWYHPFFDSFFVYSTFLGDGLIFALIGIPLLFVRWRYFLGFAATALLVLVSVGLLKQVVYRGEPRPTKYFEEIAELRVVEGVKVARHNSFPSGHTATAFAAWGFLALMSRSAAVHILLFLAAAVAGYSRIYLSQHFLGDVIAGAFIGTCIAVFTYYWSCRLRYRWADKSLLKKRPIS